MTCAHDKLVPKNRGSGLKLAVLRQLPDGPINIVLTSTGLKVFGEGERKVRQRGASKQSRWQKLRFGIDRNT